MDVSPHGFRARHDRPGLASGQIVAFEHSQDSGLARVVWNRIVGSRVETGFCYIAS